MHDIVLVQNNISKVMNQLPVEAHLEKDKTYYWCSCGLSKKQPFCDGAHKTIDGKKSMPFQVSENENRLLCNCKHTKNPPFCDGAHSSL